VCPGLNRRPTGSLVIVLASGRGERFLASGGKVHKLQAPLPGKSVLQHTLAAVRASGLPYHREQAAHPGMGDSIAAAVPLAQEVVVPVYQGQRGHPVRFSKTCGSQLMALRGQQGAASLLQSHELSELQVNDIGCVTDIDTLQDLERALQILRVGWGQSYGAVPQSFMLGGVGQATLTQIVP